MDNNCPWVRVKYTNPRISYDNKYWYLSVGIEVEMPIVQLTDESLGIDWQIPTENAILSEKDLKHPLLKDFDSPFNINENLY